MRRLAKEGVRQGKLFVFFWENELDTPIRTEVPLRRRLCCWRHGFLTRAAVLYDFDTHARSDYMNDVQYLDQWQVNREEQVFLEHKLAVRQLLQHTHAEHIPTLHGVLNGGRVTDANGRELATDIERWLRERATEGDRLVCKPEEGVGGYDVFLVTHDGESLATNGRSGIEPVLEAVADGAVYLVVEHVEQAEYAAEIYPGSANTLRIVTLWDYERDEPYVADAVHRFGTDTSRPVDNWSRGGLSAAIGLETGTLGRATRYPDSADLEWFESHPDTDARIEGIDVRGWESVADGVREMAAGLWYVPMIAWDVVSTGDGFQVIEANARPGVESLQVHRPLLRDRRTRRFFEHHGILH